MQVSSRNNMIFVSGLPKLTDMCNTSVRMSLKQFYCVWNRLILGECIPHKGPLKARNLPRRFKPILVGVRLIGSVAP